ncbi:hypothetical protein EDD16DRAFT_1710543 [Pisolithus croceorrhizus]|nr:hypothetical protein EDD16DRAFT_1710543 [Pisolithus croceorrhizus]KAI6128009.1 hypothetical protein EV401DRAFT_2067440 [Pisolithus croceorrhizus]KAI6142278.1 hypothetical protein EDD17DRAFT_1769413 [Pisolithus thermaeus]
MTANSVSPTRSSSPHVAPHQSHTLPPTALLSSQVGGYSGVQTTEDGALLFKPALPRELEFYQLTYVGAFCLLATISQTTYRDMNSVNDLPAFVQASGRTTTIVLENLTYRFRRPCSLDVKLGTILYEEDAPPEKKERMICTAVSTTSLSTGVRPTGFQVYANDHPDPVLAPKKYGKTSKPEHLPDGIVWFFPSRSPASPTCVPPSISAASNIPPLDGVVTVPNNIQPGLPLPILPVYAHAPTRNT